MRKERPAAVVIGASAGGVDALLNVLPALPEDYPLPLLVVVHLPPEKESLLPSLFAPRCHLAVCEAEDKQPLAPGTVYFAPPDYHLLVEKEMTLSLSGDDDVLFSRPAVDVLFESAADAFGAGLIAVVLTGGSDDGAKGLKAVCARGGRAIVQDPAQAAVASMPAAALAACPDAEVLSLAGIAVALQKAGAA